MKHRSSPKATANRKKKVSLNWLLFVLGGVLAAGVLILFLNRTSEPIVYVEPPPSSKEVTYLDAEDLLSQFRDCMEVTNPKNTTLEDELPLGEYNEYEYRFKLEIRTAKGLSDHEKELISSCTGIDRLYELKPLLEQRCKCKIDITCPC